MLQTGIKNQWWRKDYVHACIYCSARVNKHKMKLGQRATNTGNHLLIS